MFIHARLQADDGKHGQVDYVGLRGTYGVKSSNEEEVRSSVRWVL